MAAYNSFRPTKAHLDQLAEWHRQEQAKQWGLPLNTPAVEIDRHVTEINRKKNVEAYGLPPDADWDQIAEAARANLYRRVPQQKVTPEA